MHLSLWCQVAKTSNRSYRFVEAVDMPELIRETAMLFHALASAPSPSMSVCSDISHFT